MQVAEFDDEPCWIIGNAYHHNGVTRNRASVSKESFAAELRKLFIKNDKETRRQVRDNGTLWQEEWLTLSGHPEPGVRACVAMNGHYLHILVNDDNQLVRSVAQALRP